MKKILLALASTGLSGNELARALKELRGADVDLVVEFVLAIRDYEERLLKNSASLEISHEDNLGVQTGGGSVGEQVAQMLRDDLGLSTQQAIKYLLSEIRKNIGASEFRSLPAFNKESFSGWVNRVSNVIPPRVLLYHAASIRRRLVGRETSDWPLDEK